MCDTRSESVRESERYKPYSQEAAASEDDVRCGNCGLQQRMMENGRCRGCGSWLPLPGAVAAGSCGWLPMRMERLQLKAAECMRIADWALLMRCVRLLEGLRAGDRRRVYEQLRLRSGAGSRGGR